MFGIECPRTVEDALKLDKKNGNTMLADAIAKEMKNAQVAFDLLQDDMQPLIGYQIVWCHMIFDMRIEDFCQKVWLVTGWHMTDVPPTVMYASFVSCETVQIALWQHLMPLK